MQKYGTTAIGTQRWFCVFCSVSSIKQRHDLTQKARKREFTKWLLGTENLTNIAFHGKLSRQSYVKRFSSFWHIKLEPCVVPLDQGILIIDAIYLQGRTEAVLIGRTLTQVVYWSFAYRENYESWRLFLQHVPQPAVVVCDGRKGLLQAVHEVYPQARIQRCMAHVLRYALSLLTLQPKTEAGKELRYIVCQLGIVRTRRQKRRWIHLSFHWKKRYQTFLNQRTYEQDQNKKHWWYTHRKLRSASQLIFHALPTLFTYIGHCNIPRTSNHIEGGINARLKELLRRHRGLSLSKRKTLTAYFLSSKQKEKPTRKFT